MASSSNKPLEIKHVGILGAGLMGVGITQVVASAGYKVLLIDKEESKLEAALATINGNLTRQIARKAMSEEEKDKALSLISTATDFSGLEQSDLVIEAVTEDEDIKQQIYRYLPDPQIRRHHHIKHLNDFHYAPCCENRPAEQIHRHAFYEPCSCHGTGGTDPWYRNR